MPASSSAPNCKSAFKKICVTSLLVITDHAHACSNFLMDNEYGISVRTMDLGTAPFEFALKSVPRGFELVHHSQPAVTGFLGVASTELGVEVPHIISGGMNEQGVTCDMQTLIHTVYPNRTGSKSDVGIDFFCETVLGLYDSVNALEQDLTLGELTPVGPSLAGGQHFVVRDQTNSSLIMEFLNGELIMTRDKNDYGKTGFGIMTNEPTIEWHVENTKHAHWKMQNANPSFSLPGAFYPDERFLRIHLLKHGLPKPTSHDEAMMQAVHVLNSITVPEGAMGTDSSAGEGQLDHTLFGLIYDHFNSTVYFRTLYNQNLQRVRLHDLAVDTANDTVMFLPLQQNKLPWFNDAASAFSPMGDI